jgi:hypothetical protein
MEPTLLHIVCNKPAGWVQPRDAVACSLSLRTDGRTDVAEYQAIESDIEATRDRLAATIDQLVNRTSPKNVVRREVASLKGVFVAPDGSPRTDNILKVAGGVAGFVAVVVLIRKVTR